MRTRAFAGLAIVSAVGLAWSAPGCKKEKESLILVDLQAIDVNATAVTDVTISVSKPTGELVVAPIFDLSAGLPMTPDSITYGVYVPASAIGMLTVTAVARPATGCNGYIGTKVAKVLGGDSPKVTMIMRPGNTCTALGTAGSGGTTGTGGAGGSFSGAGGSTSACGTTVGTRPAPVGPPSLATCTDLEHNGSGLTCDAVADTNNPIIYSTAVSPDGQLMVTAGWEYFSDDVSLKIWRFPAGGGAPVQCGPEYTATALGPAYVAFSPNGQYLAVALRQSYVDIFSVPSLNMVGEIKSAPGAIYGVGFSPDSQTVFTLDYDGIDDGHLYADRVDGTAIASSVLGVDPDSLAVSPVANAGAATLAVGGYVGNLGVYSFNGSTFSTTSIMTTSGSAAAWGIAFSPDGQLLAAGTDDGSVRFWAAPFTTNATSGLPITLGSSYVPNGVAFSPLGTSIAITFGPEVAIWNVTTRAFVSRHNTTAIPGVSSPPYAISVAFSASGAALITGEDTCGKVAYCAD
jgi:hypothetical protein